MKAAILNGVNQLGFGQADVPVLHPGDMLINVKTATICGTDLRILRGLKTAGIRYPSILGHEFAGVIADAGGNKQFKAGQRVAVCPAYPCNVCTACLSGMENLCPDLIATGYQIDGAFAEFVRVPAIGVRSGNVFPIPDELPFEQAALAEPLACVINGQEQASVRAGDTVLILGAGPIGLLHIKLAKQRGAAKVIVSQRSAFRRNEAYKAGADVVIDPGTEIVPEAVRKLTGGAGADVAIMAIGVPSLVDDALQSVRTGGRVNLFAGFPAGEVQKIDLNAVHYRQINVSGAFGLRRDQFQQALELILMGKVEVSSMLTHHLPLEDAQRAFEIAASGSAIKVAVTS